MTFDSTRSSAASHDPEPAWDVALLFPAQGSWSENDYLLLTDSSNRLVEFNEGKIEVLAMPTEAHQLIVQYIFLQLHAYVMSRGLGVVVIAPFRMRLEPAKYREPDVMLMLRRNNHRREQAFWRGADLVVEVVSDDAKCRDRDLRQKRLEYADAGIPEYWIVDPVEQTMTVLCLRGTAYSEHGLFRPGDVATSAVLNDFTLVVSDAFQAGSA